MYEHNYSSGIWVYLSFGMYYPENGSCMFLKSVGNYLQDLSKLIVQLAMGQKDSKWGV
jgi:hypothetical protein